jgi:hypothetical protein
VISACFLKWNSSWKGGVSYPLKDPSRITTGSKHAHTGRLQRVLARMTKLLVLLYSSTRWLLWRWWWKLGLKLSIHVITSKFLEILGSPSYALYPSCCFMCETGTVMKDYKGMLITQNCMNVQMVMAVAFFGRNRMNETALRCKCIPFLLLQHMSASHTATVE